MYTYMLYMRPYSSFTVPHGITLQLTSPDMFDPKVGRHGAVTVPMQVPEAQIKAFELVPFTEIQEKEGAIVYGTAESAHARLRVDMSRGYPWLCKEYVEADGTIIHVDQLGYSDMMKEVYPKVD